MALCEKSRIVQDALRAGTSSGAAGCPDIINIPDNWSETMNWDRVEGNWKEFKGKAQQKWGKLTNDDLDVIEGKRTELAGRLQQHYGVAQDEAERQIDTWLKSVN
jgi:uncharacterized protein YjbJ (UPF0337 family)